jgi:hypothetical protein
VGLTRQSSEVSEKDQQQVSTEMLLQGDDIAMQIEQTQFFQADSFHRGGLRSADARVLGKKKGRPDLAPLCLMM